MLSEKQKRVIQLAIIFAGIILGSIFLSPLLGNSAKGSGLLGGFIGFLVSITIFPETMKGLFEEPSEKRMERIKKEHQFGLYRYFTHPTQIPLTLSLLLFVVIIILAYLLDFLKIKTGLGVLQAGLFVVAFLWGLSGLLMVIRNEYIDKTGRRYRGIWAILQGVILLLMGWGSIIAIILANTFHW